MVTGLAAAAGVPTPRMSTIPRFVLRTVGLVVPLAREFEEVRYQHDRPFVMDSSDFTATFGAKATPLDEAWRGTVDWWRARLAEAA
jgi:nucleoside-diphosphate-sugar epimerase